MNRCVRLSTLLAVILVTVFASGCKKPIQQVAPPDYNRELPPGSFGLRRITDPALLPDLGPAAAQLRDPAFREALQRSERWYKAASTQQFFPCGPISHAHARTSVYAMRVIGDTTHSPEEAKSMILQDFDVWESIGWDGSGEVLFTGYYTPIFRASRTPTAEFQYPLYKRPSDLVSEPNTGETLGRQTPQGLVPYPGRAEIEQSGMLQGLELVYLPSRLDAYIIEVNGSAKLNMTDGTVMYVGFAGTNGHDYTSIGKLMARDGVLDETRISLPAIREYFRQHPDQLDGYIRQNQRFVFFTTYDGANWPAGSLGFKVTPMRSLATDKEIFPRGSVTFLQTSIPSTDGTTRSFNQLMLDQDTGGAIRAAGRGDIYIGIGNEAEKIAGRQAATGRLYYLLLKPERVQAWWDRMHGESQSAQVR